MLDHDSGSLLDQVSIDTTHLSHPLDILAKLGVKFRAEVLAHQGREFDRLQLSLKDAAIANNVVGGFTETNCGLVAMHLTVFLVARRKLNFPAGLQTKSIWGGNLLIFLLMLLLTDRLELGYTVLSGEKSPRLLLLLSWLVGVSLEEWLVEAAATGPRFSEVGLHHLSLYVSTALDFSVFIFEFISF